MTQKLRMVISVVCVSMLCLLAIWTLHEALFPQTYQVAESTSAIAQDAYLLKDYEGKIALFLDSYEIPDTIYPIYTRTLPLLDQRRLERGIFLSDMDTVNRYLSDFES